MPRSQSLGTCVDSLYRKRINSFLLPNSYLGLFFVELKFLVSYLASSICWNVSTGHNEVGKPRIGLEVLEWYENGHSLGFEKFEGYFRCNSNAATNYQF